MGIDWSDWRGLTQAIPPIYAMFIVRQLIEGAHYHPLPVFNNPIC